MYKDGLVSRIQRFSLDDGPGIRTTVFMQGCNMRCPWCHNPETMPYAKTILRYTHLCRGCERCHDDKCPYEARVISGEYRSVDYVFDYIMKDIAFYKESGGGVTISGGEPLLQPDFCALLSEKCTQNNLTVIIDTAGNIPFSFLKKVLPNVHCIYFDIKTHKNGYAALGGNGELVYSNLEKLTKTLPVAVRIPVIPGFNDDREAIMQIGAELKACLISEVSLLPFHRLGVGKYKAMEQDYAYSNTKSSIDMKQIVDWFSQNQINCILQH